MEKIERISTRKNLHMLIVFINCWVDIPNYRRVMYAIQRPMQRFNIVFIVDRTKRYNRDMSEIINVFENLKGI
jgi:hypothetical protein